MRGRARGPRRSGHFWGNAYLHVPLTLDTISVSRMLNDTVSGMAGNATAIGDAIGLSVRTLRERPEGSRVLVLLTDGEDNSSSHSSIGSSQACQAVWHPDLHHRNRQKWPGSLSD